MNHCLFCGKEVKNKYCNVSCQNKHQNHIRSENSIIKRKGILKEYKVICFNCKKQFIIIEREKEFPKKEKYYCSRSCANTRIHTKKSKEKIRTSILKYFNNQIKDTIKNNKNERIKVIYKKECLNCNIIFETNVKNRKFCCRSCASTYNNYLHRDILRKAGLKSAQVQKETRRSKNEIYFAELCKSEFDSVFENKAIFNGWDADVILENKKIAILWNGKWHYKKLNKKHSVEQVQNRDKIKINEIEKAGYIPYIIKDMGKYNKTFVEEQFKIFKEYIAA